MRTRDFLSIRWNILIYLLSLGCLSWEFCSFIHIAKCVLPDFVLKYFSWLRFHCHGISGLIKWFRKRCLCILSSEINFWELLMFFLNMSLNSLVNFNFFNKYRTTQTIYFLFWEYGNLEVFQDIGSFCVACQICGYRVDNILLLSF